MSTSRLIRHRRNAAGQEHVSISSFPVRSGDSSRRRRRRRTRFVRDSGSDKGHDDSRDSSSDDSKDDPSDKSSSSSKGGPPTKGSGSNSDSKSDGKSSTAKPSPTTSASPPKFSLPSASPSPGSAASDPCAGQICIHDNDPQVLYIGDWILSGAGSNNTTHSTTMKGATANLFFNGAGIVVFGTVPASDGDHSPPTVSFSIDLFPPFVTKLPTADHSFVNQSLFRSFAPLNDSMPHHLLIKVDDAEAPFILDYFLIIPHPGSQKQVTPGPTGSSPNLFGSPYGTTIFKVLVILLGAAVLVLMCIGGFLLYRSRRAKMGLLGNRRPRSAYTKSSSKPYSSKNAVSLFTSTESILRNNSIMWSDDTSAVSSYSGCGLPSPPLPPLLLKSEQQEMGSPPLPPKF